MQYIDVFLDLDASHTGQMAVQIAEKKIKRKGETQANLRGNSISWTSKASE